MRAFILAFCASVALATTTPGVAQTQSTTVSSFQCQLTTSPFTLVVCPSREFFQASPEEKHREICEKWVPNLYLQLDVNAALLVEFANALENQKGSFDADFNAAMKETLRRRQAEHNKQADQLREFVQKNNCTPG